MALSIRNGFICDSSCSRLYESTCLWFFGRDMQIGKQHLSLALHLVLDRLWLFHRDYPVGAVEDILRGGQYRGARALVRVIIKSDAGTTIIFKTTLWP